MNMQKFTQKSLEALQNAQQIAIQNQNSQVEQEHLLLALLEQDNSLIKELIKKIGDEESIENEIRNKNMFKVKIIEWNRFNGYNIDRCKWTFINGKRVKNDEFYRINTNNLEHDKTKCYTEYKSKDIWKDITEIYYKIIDK